MLRNKFFPFCNQYVATIEDLRCLKMIAQFFGKSSAFEGINMKHLLLFLLLSSGICFVSKAQTITGKVVDTKGTPVEYANVVLLSLPDSAFIQGTITGLDGTFNVTSTQPADDLFLRISAIGYVTVYIPYNSDNAGTVILPQDTQIIGDVIVKGDLPKVQLRNDALVTNIQNTVLSRVGSGNDVLRNIPGLAKQKDQYTVFGKGKPQIYINNRLVRNEWELEQLRSTDIKSVELITNPGAQYDATVNAVLIIRTVKSTGQGFGFNVRTSQMYWTRYWGLNQLDFNYRHKGLDVFGMLFASGGEDATNITLHQQTYIDKIWEQENVSYAPAKRRCYQARFGLNYSPSDNHSFGGRYDYEYYHNKYPEIMTSNVYSDGQRYDSWESNKYNKETVPIHLVNLYYDGKVNELAVNFNTDIRRSNIDVNSDIEEESQNYDNRMLSIESRSRNSLLASKLILSHPLWKGNLSLGSEYTHTSQKNTFQNSEDFPASSANEVKESNIAAFSKYQLKFGNLNVNAGIRFEHADSKYFNDGVKVNEQSKTYNNLFPSVSINYPFGKLQTNLSYTIKTKRPSYAQLDGNLMYISRYSYSSGNSLLKPTEISDLTMLLTYKYLQFRTSYQHFENPIVSVYNQFEEQPEISLLTVENFDKRDRISIMLAASPTIGSWNINYSAGLIKQWFSMEHLDGNKKFHTPVLKLSLNNTFDLTGGWLININGHYTGKGDNYNNRSGEVKYMDIGIGKSFLKDQSLEVKLECSDVFDSFESDTKVYGESSVFHEKASWRDTRRVKLTLRYKFNTDKSKYKGTGAGQAEKERL